jgi:hypothetical protein
MSTPTATRRNKVALFTLLGLVCSLLLAAGPAQAATSGAVESLPGCAQNQFPHRWEDDSVAAVPLGFTASFFGQPVSAVNINENGNITLDAMRPNFAPLDFNTASDVMIAPFLADADIMAAGSVSYGGGTLRDGTKYFCIEWNGVGYYSGHSDKVDTFQLLLTQSPKQACTHDFTITFNYDTIAWDSAESGYGAPAVAGFAAGDGVPGHAYQLPGSATAGGLLDDNAATGLTNHSHGSDQLGRYVFPVVNAPVTGGRLHGTVYKADMSTPVPYAPVKVCRAGGGCTERTTSYIGDFLAAGLTPGDYEVTAGPFGGDEESAPVHANVVAGDNPAVELDLGPAGSAGARRAVSPPAQSLSAQQRAAAATAGSACAESPPPNPGGPVGHGSGGGPGPSTATSDAAVRQAVTASLSGQLHSLARLVARRLAARGLRPFVIPLRAAAPGRAALRVKAAATKVAAGSLAVKQAGPAHLSVKLTRRGRALLRARARSRRKVKLALVASFTPRIGARVLPAVQATATFSVRPRARRRG